ncbi:MAG: type 2 isopentenyl-diphosphate Delta-isomerase [Euryarchaeota archaeon]|nr:type 2 isopentenyl-diphosphate Delta-isomerase [Euryarchaeota archaeon]
MTQSRKKDHVDIILKEDVRARWDSWDDVFLVHEPLPEVDLDKIDLGTRFLGKRLKAPMMIASMTGGYPGAESINNNLAYAAAELGLGLGLGSQRVALTDKTVRHTYDTVKEYDVPFLAANIGAPQLIPQKSGKKPLDAKDAANLVSMIDADALIIHLNYLQEAVQPEGDMNAEGVIEAISGIVEGVGVPVIAKETGAGISRRAAERLKKCGVAAIDVGGLSGTTFAAVELVRAKKEGAKEQTRIGELFRDWGIPTPVSILESEVGLPMVATGGVRNGEDAFKALALGATLVGAAGATLPYAVKGKKDILGFLTMFLAEMRTAFMLTGTNTSANAKRAQVVCTGRVAEWMRALGHDSQNLAARRR